MCPTKKQKNILTNTHLKASVSFVYSNIFQYLQASIETNWASKL